MTTTARFITDLHIGAKNQILSIAELTPSDLNEYLLGDIFDLINCKKSDVKFLQDLIEHYKIIYRTRYILGNHEAQRDKDSFLYLNDDTGAMHGDHIFWGEDKSVKYRMKDHGAGVLKRNLWVPALEAIENGYDRKISDTDIDRFKLVCKEKNVKRIIVGHMHPTEQRNIVTEGLTLTVLKRGTTELEL